ncbi:ParA family protein [Cellulomonas marina]|uniref:Cellulose biosynthesis protein BcsQ n=1 Tax=Cellulomonas marina TaxID=988821 RepID=A0A1I0XX36_9CELL|nr:ParA family protein [Cellulomonas marina]GIG28485.1 cobyrinic acid a,c-diamide synthase [Cellulomonas marina]SFB05494.1 Cellulose biosynthesis protein BcsQ [Cellulomonas marina]
MARGRTTGSGRRLRTVAVWSVKGGVGKTTAAVNLAHAAAAGREVLLWDLDPQGGATWLLDVKPRLKGGAEALVQGRSTVASAIRQTAWETLDVLPGDATYRDLELALDAAKRSGRRIEETLEPVRDRYDLAVLDCPPAASLVARNVLRAADALVVPLPPSPLALRSLEQVLELVADAPRPVPVLAFLSMVDRRRTAHRQAVGELAGGRPDVLDVVVPAATAVEQMGVHRAPLVTFAPRSPATAAFAALWAAVERQVLPAEPATTAAPTTAPTTAPATKTTTGRTKAGTKPPKGAKGGKR